MIVEIALGIILAVILIGIFPYALTFLLLISYLIGRFIKNLYTNDLFIPIIIASLISLGASFNNYWLITLAVLTFIVYANKKKNILRDKKKLL